MSNVFLLSGFTNARHRHTGLYFLTFAILSYGITACSDSQREQSPTAEKFPLTQLNQSNNLEGLEVDIKEKILLINFWATWCAPCRKEMPVLQNLSSRLDKSRYAVIGVSVDSDINLVKEFLIQYKILYPNFIDESRYMASSLLGIEAFPETIIVSPDGTILQRISGIIDPNDRRLQQLLDLTDTAEIAMPGSNNSSISL